MNVIKINMENHVFRIRAFGRTELAQQYFPDLLPNSAWHKLKRWIEECGELRDRLKELKYDGSKRWFTAAQVKAIVYYLDEP